MKRATNIINDFNLISSKNLSLNNLHLFTSKGNIKKYQNNEKIEIITVSDLDVFNKSKL